MKIALPTENGDIFQHFGQAKEFTVFEIENHIVKDSFSMDVSDSGHGALVDKLKEKNINLLICGGLGAGALDKLSKNNIEVIAGVTGKAKDVLTSYLSGEKIGNPDFLCNHHGDHHEEDHSCHH